MIRLSLMLLALVSLSSGTEMYRDAVDMCREETNDPMVCPDPFPVFETCDDPAPNCTVAVVGAAAGGIYTAMR